jgi:hypothetical protein
MLLCFADKSAHFGEQLLDNLSRTLLLVQPL